MVAWSQSSRWASDGMFSKPAVCERRAVAALSRRQPVQGAARAVVVVVLGELGNASKTEDCAAIGLADLLIGPPHHRFYAVAGDEQQAD